MRKLAVNPYSNWTIGELAKLIYSTYQMSHMDHEDMVELVEELFLRYEHEYYKQVEPTN